MMTDPAPPAHRPQVVLTVDLDSLWAVKQVYGIPVSDSDFQNDPFYDLGLARFLDLFEKHGVRASFFAIGRDCEVPSKRDLLRRAAEQGHEIANHSFTHRIGLGNLPAEEIDDEIARANQAIENATGERPTGFRAAGFDASSQVLSAVKRAGMTYDASLLPTRVGGILRGAARFFSRSDKAPPCGKSGHYGSAGISRAPREPYLLDPHHPHAPLASPAPDALVELPAAVTPTLRLPVHSSVAMAAGWLWEKQALRRTIATTETITYLFHAIDLVGGEEIQGLPRGLLARRVFNQPLQKKQAFIEHVLELLLANCTPILARDKATELRATERE